MHKYPSELNLEQFEKARYTIKNRDYDGVAKTKIHEYQIVWSINKNTAGAYLQNIISQKACLTFPIRAVTPIILIDGTKNLALLKFLL